MSQPTPEISLEAYAAEREAGVTIDVRERGEFAQAHVPGAVLMPMGQLASRLDEIDRSARVHVICASGNRSKAMTDLLVAAGLRRRLGRRRHPRLDRVRPRRGGGSVMSEPHRRPDRDPHARRPQLPRARRRGRLRGRPAARHRPGPRPPRRARRAPHPRLRDPHPQRLRHRRPRPRAAHRCPVPRQWRGRRVLHPHPRSGRTGRRGGWTDARHRAGNPRPHVHPPLLRLDRRRRDAGLGTRSASSPAAPCSTAPPAAPTCWARAHPRPGPPPARLGPPAGRPAARRGRGLPDPRLRLLLLGHPVRRDVVDDRAREAGQPCPDPGRADLRRRAAGRPRPVAGLLRPHGPGQRRRTGRARPVARQRSPTPPSCGGASRPASGSSTCAAGRPSRPATPAARSTSGSTAASRPTSAG